jgi:adenylate kinase
MRMIIAAVALAATTPAFAVSEAVKLACKNDYVAHCNNMVVGSQELRACMRNSASKLSKPCIQALVDNKEVTEADIEAYRQQTKQN